MIEVLDMLIVDDFDIDRENIKDCIDWNEHGINIKGEAHNGREALTLLEQNHYHIVLTDVQMPFVNGIELAKEMKDIAPDTKVVFMSYYNDFEYLKSAIDLKAYGYILKPYVANEVSKIIGELTSKIMDDIRVEKLVKESHPLLVNQFYKNIFNGVFTKEENILQRGKFLGIPISSGFFQLFIIEREEKDHESISENYKMDFDIGYKLGCLCKNCGIPLYYGDDHHYHILINETSKEKLMEKSLRLTSSLEEALPELDMVYTVGISGIKVGVMNIANLYNECKIAISYNFHYGKCKVFDYEDIIADNEYPQVNLTQMQNDIRVLLATNDKVKIEHYIDKLFVNLVMTKNNAFLKSTSYGILMCLQMLMSEVNVKSSDLGVNSLNLVNEIENFTSIEAQKKGLCDYIFICSDKLHKLKNEKKAGIVDEIREYVSSHYIEDITVKEIANLFYYSPNYLNNLFKGKVGKSIPDYITEVRINKAKELLKESHMKIYEIIEAVGYKRASHFNNLFKRHTGQTPKEYRG